jgi:hypothetical protein
VNLRTVTSTCTVFLFIRIILTINYTLGLNNINIDKYAYVIFFPCVFSELPCLAFWLSGEAILYLPLSRKWNCERNAEDVRTFAGHYNHIHGVWVSRIILPGIFGVMFSYYNNLPFWQEVTIINLWNVKHLFGT